MTSSGSGEADPAGGLARRAMHAFDILSSNEDKLGLAVSGGSDSTALLVLAADWARERRKAIEVATVDHGLRPEAAEEAVGVAKQCERLGVQHTTLLWQRDRTDAAGQAEARRARHALLATWASERGIRALALGHTRDDRIETFLMRARQGSGWRGLSGPLPSCPSPVWPEGRGLRLVRPLLAFGRAELRAELDTRETGWIEDPSNMSDRFERVRMRSLTARLDQAALAQALRVMGRLAHMRAAMMAEASAGLAIVETDADAARIGIEALGRMGTEARLRLLEALLMAAGGAETAPRSEALKRLADRIGSGAGLSGGVTLAGAWIRREDASVAISQAPPRRGEMAGAGPAWDRAGPLLADPGLDALAV